MSLFDHDAKPVTPQVTLVGRGSPVAYDIRDFLQRNGENFNWVDVDQPGAIDALPESLRVSSLTAGGWSPQPSRTWRGGSG